jgi:hypothetical protein
MVWLALLAVATCDSSAATAAPVDSTPYQRTQYMAADQRYGKLPLAFEANHGQADGRVRFLSHGRGYSLFLTSSEAVLSLYGNPNSDLKEHEFAIPKGAASSHPAARVSAIRMRLQGAKSEPAITGEEQLSGIVNYFVGNDPGRWHTQVPTYGKVRYSRVYPGVDLVYYGNQQQLEFDFVVAPGSSPKPIRLQFSGAQRLRLDRDGNLLLTAVDGSLAFRRPVVYQERNGQRQPIKGRFVLLDRRTAGFAVGPYDHANPLVIDPILSYSTYFGSGNIRAITVDSAGEAYVVGSTDILDIPTTPGAFQGTKMTKNSMSAFISKFNSTGTALVYSTYLGGSGDDGAVAIAVDAEGNAYVGGGSSSQDFPVTQGAFQQQNQTSSTSTGFVTKLNSTGTALVYSTYLGGSQAGNPSDDGSSEVSRIAVDADGNAYLTGPTSSSDFPITSGAFQTVNKAVSPNSQTCFLAKMNSTGTGLDYSTYLGGSSGDFPEAIAVDVSGNAYVAGFTADLDFPTTSGAFQKTNKADLGSTGFLTKMNGTGTAPVYSTYLGGSHFDAAYAIFVDSAGDAYVTGQTGSLDFPVTPGVFQPALKAGFGNAFVTKFNSSGTALAYSTFVGGSTSYTLDGDEGLGIAVDASGNAVIAGFTGNIDYPVTPGALQTANLSALNSGNNGSFVTKLNSTGTSLLYSTYLNGSVGDSIVGLTMDGSGNPYVTGAAGSNDFPVTPGVFETYPGRIFVTKFNGSEMTPLPVPTMTLISSVNPAPPDAPVTYTAQVQPASGISIPTGTVAFSIAENGGESGYPAYGQWQPVNLDANGTASYTTAALLGGPNVISAYYLGDANNAASSAITWETRSAGTGNLPTVVVATPSANPVTFGAPVTFDITVKDPSGNGIPSGYVNVATSVFLMGQAILDAKGHASITIGGLSAGANIVYFNCGNFSSNYAPSGTSYTENVTPLGVVPAPVLSLPSGTFTSAQTLTITDAASPNAMIKVSITPTIDIGPTGESVYSGPIAITQSETVSVTAVENGYTNSPIVSATYNIQAATPTISPAGGTYTSVQKVVITDTTSGVPIYYTTDGTTPTNLSAQYFDPITVDTSETVQAIARGNGYSNSAVVSATYTINLPPPDFTITAGSSSLKVQSGQSGSLTISVTPVNGFDAAVSFVCSGLPAGVICGFSPATVTPTGAAASTTLTVTAAATTAALHRDSRRDSGPLFPGAALAALVFYFGWKKRRCFPMLLLLAVYVAGLSLLSSCGGGSSPSPQPTPQPTTSTVTVTATSGTLSQTTTFLLTLN